MLDTALVAMSDSNIDLDDTALSFDEWKAAGYFVRKGSKSQFRDINGVPQFTADQVCKSGDHKTLWERMGRDAPEAPAAPTATKRPFKIHRTFDPRRMGDVSHRVDFGRPAPARDHRTLWEKSADRAQRKGTPWGVVEDFDSFVREAGMLPDTSRRPVFAINDPLEMHFMEVADKHGILDGIIDGDYDDW